MSTDTAVRPIKVQVVFGRSPGKGAIVLDMLAVPRVGDTMRLYENGAPFLADVFHVIWDNSTPDVDVSVWVSVGRQKARGRFSRR